MARSEILAAQADLAGLEGVFAEPRGAYALAALAAETEAGRISKEAVIVVIVSGAGLKDMNAAAEFSKLHGLTASTALASIWDSDFEPDTCGPAVPQI